MEIDSSCISGSCDRRSASAIIRESGILRAVTIYVLTLIASVIDLGFMRFGHPDIGGFISTAAGIIAAGFGVTYNPVRMQAWAEHHVKTA